MLIPSYKRFRKRLKGSKSISVKYLALRAAAKKLSALEVINEKESGKRSKISCFGKIRRVWRQRKIRLMMQEINEIDQLQIMYSQFFRHNSSIQKELGMYRTYN
jgi:hypothetical protein